MAVAVLGSAGSNTPGATSPADPYTAFTYTVSAGSDRLLILFVSVGDSEVNTITQICSAVTWGTKAMTLVTGAKIDDNAWTGTEMWALKESDIAAASSTTFSISQNIGLTHLIVGAQAFSGVIQDATTFGTASAVTGDSTAPSTASITCPASGLVVGCAASDADSTFSNGQTLIYEVEFLGGDTCGGAQYRSTTGVLSWTTDSQKWSAVGVPVNPSAGAATAVKDIIGMGFIAFAR